MLDFRTGADTRHSAWQDYADAYLSVTQSCSWVLVLDLAHYFERIPQHSLVNYLAAHKLSINAKNLTERFLQNARMRDSHGILQGMLPSDFLGDLFLTKLDAFLEQAGRRSIRYVDDVLIAGESKADLQLLYRDIVEYLRGFGLQPNEAKSRVVESSIARRDHTAIDDLFSAAKAELVEELEGQHIVYGLGLAWHVDKAKRLQVELSATKALLAAVDTHPQFRQRILRFALRPLAAVGDRTVKPLVLGLLADEPVLTRDFARYLVQFPNDADVLEALAQVISEAERHDPYVVMHAIAVLSEADRLPRPALNSLMNLYRRPGHDSCRALAAIALAKLGDGNHRQDLIASYANERSDYVRAALVFSAQYFVPPEKATAKSIWSDSSALNAEIASIVL